MHLPHDKIIKFLFVISVISIITLSFLNPILKSNKEKNWENEYKEILFNQRQFIQDEFDVKNNEIIKHSDEILNELRKIKNEVEAETFEIFLSEKNHDFYVQLFDEKLNLISWGKKVFIDSLNNYTLLKIDQTFFISNKGKSYLTLIRKIEIKNNSYYVVSALLIDNLIKINDEELDFKNYLRNKYGIDVDFIFDEKADLSKDGRKYSFPILNNFKNKIAVCYITIPTLSYELEKINNVIKQLQGLILIFIFSLIAFYFLIKTKLNKPVYNILIIIILIILRILLYVFDVPSLFLKNELSNPANFSSRFAFGIVSSPIDLFLTSIFILIILYNIYDIIKSKSFLNKIKINNIILLIIALSILTLVYLMIWRAFGASIRSVIFDSSIRYFKEFNLIPETVEILMIVNILLVGLIYIVSTLLIIFIIISFATNYYKNKLIFISGLFIAFQLIGFIFDLAQKNPQGTNLIRILFITLTFVPFILAHYLSVRKIIYSSVIIILASILSVSLLTYYNSELERESLKNTAIDITRVKEPQVSFMIYQMFQYFNDWDENNITDYDVVTFNLWKNSLLKSENISVEVVIYDENKNILSEFSNFDNTTNIIYNLSDEFNISKTTNIYNDEFILYGSKAFKVNNKKIYLLIAVPFENNLPKKINNSLFKYEGKGIVTSLTNINVKLFYYSKNGLEKENENINLDETSLKELNIIYSQKENESWLKIRINNEEHLAFTLLDESKYLKLICVAKPIKSISWNLTDFFKIFFIHFLILFILLGFYVIVNIRKYKVSFYSFRTKLAFILILLSLIPMIIISNYVREIIDDNNKKIVYDKLKDDAQRIKLLIQFNKNEDLPLIKEKTNINYSLYEKSRLIYSSLKSIYYLDITNKVLDANAYHFIFNKKNEMLFLRKMISEKEVNFFFVRYNNYIIEVNDIENPQSVFLSKYDFDIIIFGVISSIIVLIIIISSFFSYQITKPIEKLNLVTKSIANGDLNVKVEINSKDEFNELAKAFNYMSQKINENQMELAQFERESAWKEMAKQVAHEIKNPLTPMKLLIQQLVVSYEEKSDKFDEIFKKVTITVLNQIEILKNIASEFSNYARMPNLKIEKINLIEIINESISLFIYENKKIELNNSQNEIFINADKDHLKRTFINLFRNSFQANANKIEVIVDLVYDNVIINIKDNGCGIEKENINKVFLPNFSTKEKGMGLGLSMAKQYIENINGNISILKTDKEGTIFQIKLPVIQ
ncbi:MAG: ATP-binding protein [Melioribacteraceae bacterium]|nr:ATP-binding protein [Melioribacteraceae bacterium]